jgi:Fibronectin type III domain.
MVFANDALAQPQHTMSVTTTANDNSPLNNAANNRRQNLYIPSVDFPTATAPGAISTIYVKASASGTFNFATFTVRASNTGLTAFTTGPYVGGLSNIYNATSPVSFTTVSGNWIKIPLQNAIPYVPTQNFIIEFNQTGFSPGAVSVCESSVTSTNRSMFGSATNPNGTAQTRLQQIGFDLAASCDVPTNIQTSNITLRTADISWDPTLGTSQYEYLVNTTRTDPTSTGYNFSNTNSASLAGLQPNTCYYIHLRSVCPDPTTLPPAPKQRESAWALDSFCTIPDCVIPNVTIDRITHNTAVASWDPVHTAYLYEYAVTTSLNADTPTSGHTTTYTNILLQGLNPNRGFQVYVRAYCSPIPISPWRFVPFHTLPTVGVKNITSDGDFAIQAYPNPATDVVSLRVFGDVEDKATVSVTNLVGGVVMSLPATGQETTVDIRQLPVGMYMMKYSDGVRQQTIKFFKQ